MEIKYTTDGKKVVVVGKLNNTETIVQEIFVAENGTEIASGENFVVKGLLDAPMETWKEKRLRELANKFDEEQSEWERKLREQSKRLSDAIDKASLKAASLFDFAHNSNDSQLERLKLFLSGKINYFFVEGLYPRISTWNDEMYTNNDYNGRVENIKLVIVAGNSKGDLLYGVSRYADGSGTTKMIVPFETIEEALAYAQKKFDKLCVEYLNDENSKVTNWLKEPIKGLVIPDQVLVKYKKYLEDGKNKRIKTLEEEIEQIRNQA